jgi:hypothetical protein
MSQMEFAKQSRSPRDADMGPLGEGAAFLLAPVSAVIDCAMLMVEEPTESKQCVPMNRLSV